MRKRYFTKRWGKARLFTKGFLPVPTLFLQQYAHLDPPLNGGEALFVLQLMDFKWDSDPPFPSYETLAQRMGISDKMARTHAKNLERKGYIRRQGRSGRTNCFDLEPLLNALDRKVPSKRKPPSPERLRQEQFWKKFWWNKRRAQIPA